MLTVRPDLGPVDSSGGTTIGTKSLLNVVNVFYLTAVDLYTDPSIVRAIREEFESMKGPLLRK